MQKLQVELDTANSDLEESIYERYISDTKKLLDDLQLQYSNVLNSRLDDLDALIADMTDMINDSASDINSTLIEVSDSVGYTMTSEMQSIWDTSTTTLSDVITAQGTGILNSMTTLSNTINNISINVAAMTKALDAEATTATSTATSSSATTSSSAKKSSSSSSSSSSSKSSSSSSSSSSKGSFFIYKKDSYPKNKLNVDKKSLFTLNTLNCGNTPTTLSCYNGIGNDKRECGTSLKLNSVIMA